MTNIPPNGFWVIVDERELFLPFTEFPWFRVTSVAAICRVERPDPTKSASPTEA